MIDPKKVAVASERNPAIRNIQSNRMTITPLTLAPNERSVDYRISEKPRLERTRAIFGRNMIDRTGESGGNARRPHMAGCVCAVTEQECHDFDPHFDWQKWIGYQVTIAIEISF